MNELSSKTWLSRRVRRLAKGRDRRGFGWLASWALLEPAAVKPNTTTRRRHWRKTR